MYYDHKGFFYELGFISIFSILRIGKKSLPEVPAGFSSAGTRWYAAQYNTVQNLGTAAYKTVLYLGTVLYAEPRH